MRRLLPDRGALVDAGFLVSLGLVASFGFRDTFTGFTYLVAAVVGWLLGIALAQLANVLKKPVILLAVFTVAAFFLLGGAVALHSEGFEGVLPLPDTLGTLADQSVHGWKDLLTTLAPVDGGPLLTLPYLLGLVAGAGGMALAGRTRSAFLPTLAPFAYLVAVILLGVQAPTRLVLLGGTFGALLTAWVSMRSQRFRDRAIVRSRRWTRTLTGAALVGLASLLATSVGPRLPFTGGDRVVLRTYVTPPFDVGEYASPLVGFRKYTEGYRAKSEADKLYEVPLLSVQGLPAGSLIRFASLDEYDGLVWRAANQTPGTTGAAGSFQRVGSVIRDGATGVRYHATVEIAEGYTGVWLPTAGALAEIHFTGVTTATKGEYFRYNLATRTGVVPQGLEEGDEYSFTAMVSDDPVDAAMVPSSDATLAVNPGVDFSALAQQWSGSASTPTQQVLAIAHHLRDVGKYTDGEVGNEQYLAGHSTQRLSKFSVAGGQVAGDDEQYAAMVALLANQVGVSARAVVGAKVPADGVVRGKDVRAWVELKDESGAWRVLPTEEFMSKERDPDPEVPLKEELTPGEAIPPPAQVNPPSVAGDPLSDTLNQKGRQSKSLAGLSIPSWLIAAVKYIVLPLTLLVGLVGGIVLLKARRRRRRRTRGDPSARLAAAWRELVDEARDLGHTVYGHRTRREQARDLGLHGFAPLAGKADAYVFGPTDPTDADAADFWGDVDAARMDLVAGLSWRRRLRTAVSLASFRELTRREAGA